MTQLHEYLTVKTRPVAAKENVIMGEGYRLTVLTPSLLRVEISKENAFCDEATQCVWNRDFPVVAFDRAAIAPDKGVRGAIREVEGDKTVVVETEKCRFVFSAQRKKVMTVFLKEENRNVPCDGKGNFGGTRRTLDQKTGRVRLEKGILSSTGVAVVTDDGFIVKESGELGARKGKETDTYVFAYGKRYKAAISDYFYLTGRPPMLPRYVLGNWWSRYYAYTQKEYLDLMTRFEKENLPFTVATVDMDWHWVKVNEHFGTNYKKRAPWESVGWTGYSWNTDLFPDYKAFLKELQEKNYRVTLNLHPAVGVRAFEDMYEEMAKAVGVDPATKETIPFDIGNNDFLNAYFDILHHPYEKDGVDFWWIDWQQGKKSTIPGVDPLWALNHYHYLDNARGGKRGLILSRYCGIGSHRYPLGFSGDYVVRWRSLTFQPEFTNTAANIGYTWWSHDIGGHMFGRYDDEMYLRWCQYGVFSPINRLHSTAFLLQGKEPWKHSKTVSRVTGEYLRLRHALIPYVYTAMRRTYEDGTPLCEPLYYEYPEEDGAYFNKNQYFFGSELLVCPITKHTDPQSMTANTTVWLPEGRFTDFFTGQIYEGGKYITLCRDLEDYPVLCKAGAIVPTSAENGNVSGNPEKMKIYVYRGNNSYVLYEDDGETNAHENGAFTTTAMSVEETGDTVRFTVYPAQGDLSLIPEKREITVVFRDLVGGDVTADGKELPFGEVTIRVESAVGATITVTNAVASKNEDVFVRVNEIFSRCQGNNVLKMLLYRKIAQAKTKEELLRAVKKSRFPKGVKAAAIEVLTQE